MILLPRSTLPSSIGLAEDLQLLSQTLTALHHVPLRSGRGFLLAALEGLRRGTPKRTTNAWTRALGSPH